MTFFKWFEDTFHKFRLFLNIKYSFLSLSYNTSIEHNLENLFNVINCRKVAKASCQKQHLSFSFSLFVLSFSLFTLKLHWHWQPHSVYLFLTWVHLSSSTIHWPGFEIFFFFYSLCYLWKVPHFLPLKARWFCSFLLSSVFYVSWLDGVN